VQWDRCRNDGQTTIHEPGAANARDGSSHNEHLGRGGHTAEERAELEDSKKDQKRPLQVLLILSLLPKN
jgi:hypothetical protein